MRYDFENLIKRGNAGSFKWDEMKNKNPNVGEGVVPLSVADMELKNPPEIIEGLKEFLDHNILGYTGPTEAYYESIIYYAALTIPSAAYGRERSSPGLRISVWKTVSSLFLMKSISI